MKTALEKAIMLLTNVRCEKIKIIDITKELNSDIQIYEGDPRIRVEQILSVDANGFAITEISMGSHSGTHVDAPSHVISEGRNVSEIPLSDFVGECVVLTKKSMKIPAGIKKVIIKGEDEKSGKINEQLAQKLVDAGIRLVGTNSISIGNDAVHDILLGEGCLVLESLELSKAVPGVYMLCALPLKIAADGSPIRACLIQGVCE